MIKLVVASLLALVPYAEALPQSQDDPIVMTVAGVPVPRSEFEYSYNKNNTDGVIDKKTVEEYVDLFVNYKLKVQAALDAHIDTTQAFLQEFAQYRDQQVRPTYVTDEDMLVEAHKVYDQTKESIGPDGLVHASHILVKMEQKASKAEIERAKQRIDSIYGALQAGADFAELAKKVSQDPGSASRGGLLPWIGPNQTLKEFEDVAYSLNTGQISTPFLSTVGYHIVKMADRKDLEPFDTLHAQIHRFIESRGVRMQLSQQIVDSLSHATRGGMSVDEILDRETERLCAQDQELKYLVQEYHDGLLYYDICNNNIWEPAKTDTLGLEKYFKQNKKKYAWDKPHFYGMIFYCKNAGDVNAVKKAVKGVSEDKWIGVIRDKFNKDSVMVKMDRRLFAKGDNKIADKLIFKVKDQDAKTPAGYPHTGYRGRMLKKGPAKWTDISQKVIQDLQDKRMSEWVETLRQKYPVVVNEEVLNTVNSH